MSLPHRPERGQRESLQTMTVGDPLPEWQLQAFLKSGSATSLLADRQAKLYLWTRYWHSGHRGIGPGGSRLRHTADEAHPAQERPDRHRFTRASHPLASTRASGRDAAGGVDIAISSRSTTTSG